MTPILGRIVFVAALVLGPGAWAADGPRIVDIDNATLERMIADGVTVIDVRRSDEWRQTGVIASAKRITAFDGRGRFVPSFPTDLEAAAARADDVVLICWRGNRSAVLSRALTEQAGYARVYNVVGGMRSWLAEGRPVTPCPAC